MQIFAVLALSVGLAMDATAVAATRGFANPGVRPAQTLRLAALFGAFQGGMPVIGWAVGARFAGVIGAWEHWVAFVLLAGIGTKMLVDVVREPAEATEKKPSDASFDWRTLLLLAVATSIDALVAGLTLPMLEVPIALATAIIGATTAVLSVAGVYLGRELGARVGRKLDALGGVVLIGLGAKILLEHLLTR